MTRTKRMSGKLQLRIDDESPVIETRGRFYMKSSLGIRGREQVGIHTSHTNIPKYIEAAREIGFTKQLKASIPVYLVRRHLVVVVPGQGG